MRDFGLFVCHLVAIYLQGKILRTMAAIRDVAEVLVKINDEEAKSKLPALQKRVEKLSKEFDECLAQLFTLSRLS